MAQSNYRVLTDVDLSNNKLYNTLCIANTEKDSESLLADPDGGDKPLIQTSGDSKSLLIRTDGDTVLAASNLTGKIINGKTSLKTGTSEVVVTNTATENITNSKTTIVATTTREDIDSSGINVKTPSQTVVASGKSETISPSVTLATGPLDPDDRSERASITLTKVVDNNKGPKVATSAKTIAVDATDTITQTASTSTYRADDRDVNSLKLTTDDVKLKSDSEAITLTKAKDGAAAKTEIHSNNLVINATVVEVKENTTTSVKASNSVSVGVGSGDPSPTTIEATTSNVAIKSDKVAITGKNAADAIKLVAGTTSISVLPQQIKLDSGDKLFLESDEGVAINDLKSATITAPIISEKASTKSEVKSPSVTLVTGPFADSDSTKQASLTLTKTANIDNSKVDVSAKTVTVDASVTGGSITQTAPTSTYKTSEDNKIVLDNTGITLTNNSEVAKLGNGMTSVAGTRLDVTTTTVNINHTGTSTISANDIHLHTKGDNPASSLDISSGETALKSPKVTLNGTGSEGVTVKSGDNSSSVAVKSTIVKIDSKGTLDVAANGNISVDNPGFTIDIDTKDVLEKATASSTVRSPKITLVTGTPEGTGNNKQAKIALTKTANIDDSTINSSAKTVEVTATGSITQTAPTSTYQTDKTGSNRLKLTSGNVEIRSGTEVITLTKDTSTRIDSSSLTVDADDVTVMGSETTSIEASNSVSVDIGPRSNPFTTIDATTTEIALASKKVSLTASVTESGAKKSSSIILLPAEETSLAIITDKNLKINSVSGDVDVTGATLNSNATILANKDLTVAGTATFNSEAKFTNGAAVKTLDLDGVTIKWDSTLGALTFSKG